MKRQDFSKTPKANNMMKSYTNLLWPWVLHGLASSVKLASTLLIMLTH
ncbi:hypothetical protein CsSME_00035375 [Camellia sinensis var. sinensis]